MMAYRSSGVLPQQLADAPELPSIALYIWDWFIELSSARSSGFGISPIGYGDIADWSNLNGRKIEGWEVSAIRRLDIAYLNSKRESS